MKEGYRLCSSQFNDKIDQAVKLAGNGKAIIVYCWRGGLRSRIIGFLLETAGLKVSQLKEGYKSYRRWVNEELSRQREIIILGGRTGSGKTRLLKELALKGEPVIDLEEIANHRGSAFGALGKGQQPGIEFFENKMAEVLKHFKSDQTIWVENESRKIGTVVIPGAFFEQMRNSSVIDIEFDRNIRTRNILEEYGHFSKHELAECTIKVRKKLGDLRCKQALDFLQEDRLEEWIGILLDYYDKTYLFGLHNRPSDKIIQIKPVDLSYKNLIDELIKYKENVISKTNEVN